MTLHSIFQLLLEKESPEFSNPVVPCNLIIFVFQNPLSHGNWKQLKSHEHNFHQVVLESWTIFVEKSTFFPRKRTVIKIGTQTLTEFCAKCQGSNRLLADYQMILKSNTTVLKLHIFILFGKFDHWNRENVTFSSKIFTIKLHQFIKAVLCNIYYRIQIYFYSHKINQMKKPQPIVPPAEP